MPNGNADSWGRPRARARLFAHDQRILNCQVVTMRQTLVTARARGGEPVKRTIVAEMGGTVYLSNPAALDRVLRGEILPIGFPANDVFAYDAEVFCRLRDSWERGVTPDWSIASPRTPDQNKAP